MIEKIVICGTAYTVEEVIELQRESDGAYLYGSIMHTSLMIQVDKELHPIPKAQTLLHEALHGIFHYTGYIDVDNEEQIVQMLGCQLPKFLRDNPELVKLLLED